ncbi:HEPN domain protein [Methanobrevibacter cuticularis]|uniref:HEPN domain protein n=1 Tax=Methanobrevibacter cuticularis TaxID=47311 RepID=A0A166DL99_9EURY|nr:HEPN domain-containing protein [Methanobrevibacter cuticularis]KZX15715.1 HEPN domain protein [Methanobrevibacter cuticularis]
MDSAGLLFNEAEERLINAKIALENERYNLCVSESYYAIFYGAKSLLSSINVIPKTHSGVMSEFSKHYLKTKLFNIEIGKYYFEFEKNRNKADYDILITFNKFKAKNSIDKTTEFLKECEKFL